MRRGALLVIAAIAAIAAIVLWRIGSRDGEDGKPAAGASANVASAATRVDPDRSMPSSLTGTIRDVAASPIAGARVCVDGSSEEEEEDDDDDDDRQRDSACTDSDASGRFTIDHLLPADYTVTAAAKSFRPGVQSSVGLAAGERRTGIDMILHAGGVELVGTVSDITGGPIVKARVSADSDDATVTTETDAAGKFVLWVNPGDIEVSASADGYLDEHELEKRAPAKIDFLLTPASTLAGTVVDAASGAPVAGAKVSLDGDLTFTDNSGAFRFDQVSPERHVVTALADRGYGRTEGSVLVGLGQHVDGVVVKLFAARRIDGRVVIAGSRTPCEHAWVTLRDVTADRDVWATGTLGGAVQAQGVVPGTYSVETNCRGFLSKEYEPLVVGDKDLAGLVWEVETGGTIRGRVLTRTGQPVEGAEIVARATARMKQGWGNDRSSEDGSYALSGLRAGSYKIDVGSTDGIGPSDGYKIDLAPGATVQRDLVLVEDAGTIRGTVVDTEGNPVGGVEVEASMHTCVWSTLLDATSDDSGAFVIAGLRAGDYRVSAQESFTGDATPGKQVTVRATQIATVQLVVETRTGVIRGTVIDASGAPVVDAWVSAARASDAADKQTRWSSDDKPVLTGADGSFRLAELAPGSYTVRAYRRGGGAAIAENVATGSTTKLQIKATGSIAGVVKSKTGGKLDEIEVAVVHVASGVSREESFFRTDGRFAIDDLPGGKLELTASAGGSNRSLEVHLADGERKTGIALELDARVTITGRVVESGTNKPVSRIRMFALPDIPSFWFHPFRYRGHVTDESGRFAIENAPTGKVTLRGMPDSSDSDYLLMSVRKTIEGSGAVDVGDLTILKDPL